MRHFFHKIHGTFFKILKVKIYCPQMKEMKKPAIFIKKVLHKITAIAYFIFAADTKACTLRVTSSLKLISRVSANSDQGVV